MTTNRPSKLLLVALLSLSLPVAAQAVTFVTQPDVFTPDVLTAPSTDATYYGELTDWPHTFTFVVSTPTPVQYTVATAADGAPVSLLLVREARRGVEEVARQNGATVAWQALRDPRLGVALRQAPTIETTLDPGRYKLEISSPVNQGKYQLAVGAGSSGGYWATIRDTFVVHNFYGHWSSAFATWRVLLLGLLVAGLGWWLWRRSRHRV